MCLCERHFLFICGNDRPVGRNSSWQRGTNGCIDDRHHAENQDPPNCTRTKGLTHETKRIRCWPAASPAAVNHTRNTFLQPASHSAAATTRTFAPDAGNGPAGSHRYLASTERGVLHIPGEPGLPTRISRSARHTGAGIPRRAARQRPCERQFVIKTTIRVIWTVHTKSAGGKN